MSDEDWRSHPSLRETDFCSDCRKAGERDTWFLKIPGSNYCYEHRKARARKSYHDRVARVAQVEATLTREQAYGFPTSEVTEETLVEPGSAVGITDEEYRKEIARLEALYGPPPTSSGD